MNDENAFIQLIWGNWVNHDEPLPRLIYADWLDDFGEPPWTTKAAFLRLWCRLHATPLHDLDGYTDLTTQLEALRPTLPGEWLDWMNADRFQLTSADAALVRANTFLGEIISETDYELHFPYTCDGGWVVYFSLMPTIDLAAARKRQKEHKRSGSRKQKRRSAQLYRWQLFTYTSPPFVESKTGRVTWYHGS